jgi:crossover junction endodeoxyribonuclease RuvC
MVSIVIGIDPGFQGAVAALEGPKLIFLKRTPRIRRKNKVEFGVEEMADMISQFKDRDAIMYLEKVHAMPMEGVKSSFNFGKGYGMWIMSAAANKIPLVLVTPQEWKKEVVGDTDKSKEASIMRAKELFPDTDLKPGRLIRDHDGLAEAILIAFYGGMKQWSS